MKVIPSTSHLLGPLGAAKVQRRKANMDRIRQSLGGFALLRQNQDLTSIRRRELKHTFSMDGETDSSSGESREVRGGVCKGELFGEKYQVLEKLGEGSNGIVHRCRKTQTGEEFAVKSFTFEEEHLQGLKANFLVMKRLRHRNIIHYEALYIDLKKRQGWLVMELVQAPDLSKVPIQNQQELKMVMHKIMDTLDYLHSHDMVHRDIKLENILYKKDAKLIKIIDFGISRRLRRGDSLIDMWTITGTLYYRAPEMFEGGYRQGVDVWAAGVLLYKLACGKTPFQSQYHNQTVQNIIKDKVEFTSEFDKYSLELRQLIQKMLTKDKEKRVTASTCLRDVWFSRPLRRQGSMNFSEDEGRSKAKDKAKKVGGRMKAEMSLRAKGHESLLVKKMRANELVKGKMLAQEQLNSVHPYVRKINGAEFLCIDSQWRQAQIILHRRFSQ